MGEQQWQVKAQIRPNHRFGRLSLLVTATRLRGARMEAKRSFLPERLPTIYGRNFQMDKPQTPQPDHVPDAGKMTSQTTVADEMSIERWAVYERMRLEEFMAFWRNGAAGNNIDGMPADAFPATMPIGEWDEQYRSFGGG